MKPQSIEADVVERIFEVCEVEKGTMDIDMFVALKNEIMSGRLVSIRRGKKGFEVVIYKEE